MIASAFGKQLCMDGMGCFVSCDFSSCSNMNIVVTTIGRDKTYPIYCRQDIYTVKIKT